MNNETQKLIEDQLNNLPIQVREALQSIPWREVVKEIATSHNLNADQSEVLERETILILYGFENPLDYPDNLMRELGVDEETSSTIALEVSEKIFKPFEEKIKEQETQPNNERQSITPHQSSDLLPVVEEGEVAHEVPHIEPTSSPAPITPTSEPISTPPTVLPQPPSHKVTHYPEGVDPYREPIE